MQAFASFDFNGKGYLIAKDIYLDKINYKMPLTQKVSKGNHEVLFRNFNGLLNKKLYLEESSSFTKTTLSKTFLPRLLSEPEAVTKAALLIAAVIMHLLNEV